MVEPDKKDLNKTTDLEDTVRNLREENAKLIQLLRSQGLLPSTSNSLPSLSDNNPTNLTFDHSDLTLTTNSINTTNEIHHQHINNHDTTNQQNYNEQTIHGNQSNLTPNFNTVIQSTSQPFVQNNSNTLVQNNTNLIQPINLVNFNNVSLDSIQSFFASQNNLVYLPQSSSVATAATTTTTTTTTATTSSNVKESLSTNIHSLLNPSLTEHQLSIRPKNHPHQELVPVIPKIKTEQYENIRKQYSSSNNDTTNLLDNDSNDPKQKYPRPIRPKPSSRGHSIQTYKPVVVNETKTSSFINNNSPTISLFSSPSYSSSPSSSTNYLSQSSIEHQIDHSPALLHSKSLDLSVPSTTSSSSSTISNKKSNKNRIRNRKKPSTSSSITISSSNNSQTPVSIAPNLGRPLAPAPLNVQRSITSNNPITKRSNKKSVKRNSKSLVQYHSESILQQNSSCSSPPPSNSFAESISGLLENFDQELIASNFLSQTTITTDNSIVSSNTTNLTDRQESYNSTIVSMPTLDEFNNRLDNPITHEFNVENEQITSFMNEEDMRLVEMNFDENTFLKQFDLEDPGIKLSVHSDRNLFANILTTNNDLIQQTQHINEQSTSLPLPPPPPPPPPPVYPGSSLINNNVFTTVVPLGLQQQTSQTNNFITNNTNTTRLLPEEGVQLTARHIEPSQVATYESAKYQDILDDLVMVTDQDALNHAQATAENDPSVISTDFSFALLEATNEIIKNTNIQIVENNSSTFNELQYFYPIEQEQEILQKQFENCQDKQQEENHPEQQQQQPIVILEKLQSQILASTDINKNLLEDSVLNTSITDLSSILQFQTINSPIHHDTSTTELITPIRPTKTVSSKSPLMDFDSLLPLPPPSSSSSSSSKLPNSYDKNNTNSTISYSPILDTLCLSSNSLQQQQQQQQIQSNDTSKPCVLFEPISSSSNPTTPIKSTENEMIIDSGRFDDLTKEKTTTIITTTTDVILNDNDIEDLLNDTTNKQYEIIENQGQTLIKNHHVHIDDVNQLIEQIEPNDILDPKRTELLEQTFSRYQEKYQLNLQRQQDMSLEQTQEQVSLTIPPVKLKLNSIYSHKSLKKKKKRKSPSPSSLIFSPKQSIDDQPSSSPLPPPPVERPRLKIKIRTKLPTPPPVPSPPPLPPPAPSEEKTPNKKLRKTKKKKSHHHHHHQHQKKTKTIADQLETEYAGLTRFERPLAQLYHQQSPPTSDKILLKDENHSSPLLTLSSNQSESQPSTIIHSGFIIDEQTPPSSITSIEHKTSPPPLLINQTKTDNKLKQNYSHLFNYENNNHNHHEHQNNNTFITPPPEIDLNLQSTHKINSYENFCSLTNISPNKKKQHHRKSSVTSSSSSKSLSNTDYAIDTQALEPVSPTPISTSKQKHTQNPVLSSSSSLNYNDQSPPYFEHQQQKQIKDHYSKKSSSSSNRSSRPITSQMYQQQSRSLSNHNYRPAPEPPLIPPILPPPPPSLHIDPYAQSYPHPFIPRAAAAAQPPPPPPFFNFPFSHPFLNPHSTPTPSHFHPHPHAHHHHHHGMKYSHPHPHAHHHSYPTHQQQYSYHPHLHRQQQYNNSNYMSSRDHHSFDR